MPIYTKLITFYQQGLKIMWFKFGENWINCLGGVLKKLFFEQIQNGGKKVLTIMAYGVSVFSASTKE